MSSQPMMPDEKHEPDTFRYAFSNEKRFILELITREKLQRVCEVGGGRSPLFDPEEVAGMKIDYTLLDISDAELAKAPESFKKVRSDICDAKSLPGKDLYDLVFSIMLAEHVTSASAMHRNIRRLLRPDGYAFHFFPTLYSPAFVVNKLLPERAAVVVLEKVLRGHPHHEKFPARYMWCFGPTARSVRRLEEIGYKVVEYRGFYGTEYLRHVPVAGWLEERFHRAAKKRQSKSLTSYAWVVLRKT